MKPEKLTYLEEGKAVGAHRGFAATFNWLVRFCSNIRGGLGVIVDTTDTDHPVVRMVGNKAELKPFEVRWDAGEECWAVYIPANAVEGVGAFAVHNEKIDGDWYKVANQPSGSGAFLVVAHVKRRVKAGSGDIGVLVHVSALGVAGGVAQLGSDGKLKDSQMPAIPEPPTPVPIDPAEATDEGQFADALATKTALDGKVDAEDGKGLVELDTNYEGFAAKAVTAEMIKDDQLNVVVYIDSMARLGQSPASGGGRVEVYAFASELPYKKTTYDIGTRQVYTLTATTAQSVTLPSIPNTDEVLNCDIVVNGTGASADFGLTLVGGTGVNVYYPDGEAITCKAGCITMVSSVGINGIGWLVVGCNNLKTAS